MSIAIVSALVATISTLTAAATALRPAPAEVRVLSEEGERRARRIRNGH
jgi:hypothetical protein